MQRSDGGGFGSAGGTNGGLVSGRSAATAITKLTWFFATAFLLTSITLTVISGKKTISESIIDDEVKQDSLTIPLPTDESLKSIEQSGAPTLPPINE